MALMVQSTDHSASRALRVLALVLASSTLALLPPLWVHGQDQLVGQPKQGDTAKKKKEVPASSAAVDPSKAARRQTNLDRAKAYLDARSFADARKIAEAMLEADPTDAQAAAIVKQSLAQEHQLNARRQNLVLDEAEWQRENGSRDNAVTLAGKVADAATDQGVLDRAAKIEAAARPGKWRQFGEKFLEKFPEKLLSWPLDAIIALGGLVALWGILRGIRWGYAKRKKNTWVVEAIQDSTGLGAGVIAGANLLTVHQAWDLTPPVSAGLLNLQALPLPSATALLLKDSDDNRLIESIGNLPICVGTVNVGALAKFLQGVLQWFKSDLPRISGSAFMIQISSPAQVLVRLTCHGAGGNARTVAARVTMDANIDAARIAAEKAAFKMYYLIAIPRADEAAADSAENLRDGLAFLQSYVDGQDATKLIQALEKFQAVRTALPDLWDAYLYEGITLDLLERHDDAILRFDYVERNTKDTVLKQKAQYNRAVALLRKYRPDDLQRAYVLFEEVSQEPIDLLQEPIKTLAKVGKANALAHYLIFWDVIFAGRQATNDNERLDWKRQYGSQVEGLVDGVEAIASELAGYEGIIDRCNTDLKSGSKWDDKARRQLEWGRLDAVGNAHLNFAMGFCQSPWQAELGDAESLRQKHLDVALENFRRSEMVLPPGVETLSNVATTYIYLERYGDARNYLNQAIHMNPNYEYAYYRMAQSWDRGNRPLKAIEVLNQYKVPLRIQGFKELFQKYNIAMPE